MVFIIPDAGQSPAARNTTECCPKLSNPKRGVPAQKVVEDRMQNWKKAVIFGSVGAGAILFFTGRRSVGTALAAGGLAVLASEYPERFEAIWENAPEYLQRGTQIFATLQKIGERFAEAAEERGAAAWSDIREYGR